MTSSPSAYSGVSMPTRSTVPDTSQQGTTGNTTSISGSSPPAMIFQSTGLTEAYFTRTRTSPGPSFGSGSRVSVSTSVPPYVS